MNNENELKKQKLFTYKLKNDFEWYAKNFLKIRDKKSQLINFCINEPQKVLLKKIEEDRKNNKPQRYIILKARQLGFSTFTEGLIYHDTSTTENTNSLIIAHEDKASQNLFNMSKLFYEESPAAIRPMKKYSNEKALVFENPTADPDEKKENPGLRSKISVATAGTSDTARSGTYHNLHVSELAFFPNPKNTMIALLQCVPDEPNTLVIVESTANGVGGYFYDMWNDAVEGKNDFVPLFFPWFADKNYTKEFETEEEKDRFYEEICKESKTSDGKLVHTEEYYLMKQFDLTLEQLYWRQKTIENKCAGDVEMFHQEYPSTPQEAFVASGRSKFDKNALKKYELNCKDPLLHGDLERKRDKFYITDNSKGSLKIWQEPKEDHTYYIGADVAEGLITGDYSVATVLDESLSVVAKYRTHIDPDLYGNELVKLGEFYNYAYIAVENNNHGLTTIKSILQEGYYNIYYSKVFDKVNDTFTRKVGWSTNSKTKPLMIDKLAEYIREHFLVIKDMDIVDELYTYVIDDKGRTNAQAGKHDDCVMSLGIALQASLDRMGDEYIPEIPNESPIKHRENFDCPEIIDPLFEEDENEIECT